MYGERSIGVIKMSRYSRLASTDAQEAAIIQVEQYANENHIPIVGATRIGKSPQTVILDLTYQGSEIYINSDGEIKGWAKLTQKG